MNERKAIALSILICLLIAFVIGCVSELLPQPKLHPVAGTSVMFVPEGCKIGDVITLENGIYISESKLIELIIQQREEEERRKRQFQTQIQ